MKRFYVNFEIEVGNTYKIEGVEHNHIKNVMRMSMGNRLILVCGDSFDYMAEIVGISKGDTKVIVLEKERNIYNSDKNVTVFQAMTKSDNMTLIIQKLTELGVNTFIPFESEFVTSKDKFGKTAKMQEISNQSIKQCKRSIPMKVLDAIKFDELINALKDYDLVIFANECEKNDKLSELEFDSDKKIAIIIGSEGGFSDTEISKLIAAGAKSVTMGKRILRAETASIALASVVMFKLGEWEYE